MSMELKHEADKIVRAVRVVHAHLSIGNYDLDKRFEAEAIRASAIMHIAATNMPDAQVSIFLGYLQAAFRATRLETV